MARAVYDGDMLDITGPEHVQVTWSADSKVLWINIDGVCKLRVCRIGKLIVDKPNDEDE